MNVKTKYTILKNLVFAIVSLLAAYVFIYLVIFKPYDCRCSSFGSIPILDPKKIYPGYTLISPYNRLLSEGGNWESEVYLIDMLGAPVHVWKTSHQALYSVLEHDGKLLTLNEQPKYSQFYPPGGNTGRIQEIDWDSNVVWEYKNDAMHHDIAVLPNGDLAFALWEKTPSNIASNIQGGAIGTEMKNGLIWSDELVEINRQGKIVWSWHSYENLDPQKDVLGPLMPRYAWTYTNGIKYIEKNPVDGTPAFLVSMRSISTLLIIRKSDGAIIWRSPKDMLNLQHDPTYLENGNILVFDNGLDRVPAPFPIYGSRVVEINPKTNKIVWNFDGGEGAIDKIRFFAPIVGGAQRLPNGNTLITDGPRGHIFEVTQKGDIVWDMVSPYVTKRTGAFPNNFLFKSRRYSENEIKWPGQLPPAFNNLNFNLYKLLDKIYTQ